MNQHSFHLYNVQCIFESIGELVYQYLYENIIAFNYKTGNTIEPMPLFDVTRY